MKPKPFASLNHFTVPVAMTEPSSGALPLVAPAVMAVSSADRADKQKRRANWISHGVSLEPPSTRPKLPRTIGNMTNPGSHRQHDSCPARRIPTAMVVRPGGPDALVPE